MTQINHYWCLSNENKGFKCVKIPYKDNNFTMVIILPKKNFAVDDLMNRLSIETMSSTIKGENFHKSWYAWNYLSSKSSMIQVKNLYLSDFGMKDAFDDEKSDFSAMSIQSKDLYVSKAVHKTSIETTEEGTEAAAATASNMGD